MAELHCSEIRKGSNQTVRIRLLDFAGEVRLDLRVHQLGIPGTGFTLPPDGLPALIAALQETERAADAAGLLTPTADAA